jgi:transglutaminase-like putative cysteine protease
VHRTSTTATASKTNKASSFYPTDLVRSRLVGVAIVCVASIVGGAGAAKTPAPTVLLAQDLVVNLAGEEVGTMSARDVADDRGTTLVRTAELTIRRGQTVARMKTSTTVTLDTARRPLRYRFEKTDPSGTLVTDGVVSADGKTLKLTTTQNGAAVDTSVPLPEQFTFAVALEHEVRRAPRDGFSVTRPVVLEEMGAVVPMTTTVKKDGDAFVVTATFAGLSTEERIDARGRTILARTPAVGIVAYPWGQAPPDIKEQLRQGKKADLLAVSTWKTKAVPPSARRVVYRVTTPGAATFTVPEDARQKVLSRTGTQIEIEVKAGPSTTTPLAGPAKAKALSATPYEAIQDPRLKKAAVDAAAGATDPAEIVKRLSAFVYRHVQKKGLDRGYAPAIATLESRSGDCTEHSVLLSALLRSLGLPTRIVDGVVVDGGNAGYHEWVEVDLGAGFVAVDPTFDAWPAGPQRLKLAEGSTLPDEHLGLSLAAARLLQSGVVVEVMSVE